MKIIKRFLLWFIILLVIFFAAASAYVKIYGKSLMEEALSTSLKRSVVLGEVAYSFPLGIQIQDVFIAQSQKGGEFLRVKKIVAQLSPCAIYQRRLAFGSVVFIEPSVVIEKIKIPGSDVQKQTRRHGVIVPPAQTDSSVVEESRDEDGQMQVSIKRLIVKRGRLQYVSDSLEEGFSFNLEDVRLKANQIVFPLEPGRLEFSMSARLIKEGNPLSGSSVRGYGWVDVVKRDMDAKIEVVEADGTVGLTVEAVSRNNEMEVSGEVKMQNLLWGAKRKISSDATTINDFVLDALSSAGVEIGAKFSFKTKMDDFQMKQVSFSGNVVTK